MLAIQMKRVCTDSITTWSQSDGGGTLLGKVDTNLFPIFYVVVFLATLYIQLNQSNSILSFI